MLQTSEHRGEVVVGAWSPSASDLIRPLPPFDTKKPRWGFSFRALNADVFFGASFKTHGNGRRETKGNKTKDHLGNTLLETPHDISQGHKIFIRFIRTLYIADFGQKCSVTSLTTATVDRKWTWQTNVGGEKEISGQGNLHASSTRLAIDLAEHDVLCACQDKMGLNENVKDTQLRMCTRESAIINSPMMATTSASMCPWAILSRPAWEKNNNTKHSWTSWITEASPPHCTAVNSSNSK